MGFRGAALSNDVASPCGISELRSALNRGAPRFSLSPSIRTYWRQLVGLDGVDGRAAASEPGKTNREGIRHDIPHPPRLVLGPLMTSRRPWRLPPRRQGPPSAS